METTAADLLSPALPALPDTDATELGTAVELAPLAPTDARLVALSLSFELDILRDAWRVRARYGVHNPGTRPISLRLGLTEEDGPRGLEDGPPHGLSELAAAVRDEPCALRPVAPVPPDAAARWTLSLVLLSGETVPVDLHYTMPRSQGLDWWPLRVRSSSDTWGGPAIQLTLRLPGALGYVIHPARLALRSYQERLEGDGSWTTVELEGAPGGDFSLHFSGPSIEGLTSAGFATGYAGDLDTEEIADLVAQLHDDALAATRDLIYARHGYAFKDPDLRAAASTTPALPDWAEGLILSARPENPDFSPALFNPGERALVHAIVAEEERRGSR